MKIGSRVSASKIEKTQVFLTELGVGVLTIWKFILNEFPPLSPPTLTHISDSGILPLCQFRLLHLENNC